MKIGKYYTTQNLVTWAKNGATVLYDTLPSWCYPDRHLRFKAYCVGMAKTGTVSLHIMFSKHYRSAHEPDRRVLVHKILAMANGKIDRNVLTSYIKHRDRRLGLEMDSSHLNYHLMNYHLIDILVSEFPEARFILTIRDCYSWLDSATNFSLARPVFRDKHWSQRHLVALMRLRFRADELKHVKEEKVLAEHGFYTLDGYFSFWKEHNSKILATVPKEQLLVVKTSEINQRTQEIESFLQIPTGSLPIQVRGNVAHKKFHILSKIDRDFLEEKANLHCKDLMDKYFPEVRGLSDVLN